jgi:type VI protein secretion system component Hcp
MSLNAISGRFINETAGPVWHLVGSVTRDTTHLSRITLIRKIDQLSPKIRAALGRNLASLTVPDPNGGTFNLLNAVIQPRNSKLPPLGHSPKGGSSHGQVHSNEQEEFNLVFQKITYSNSIKSKSASDNWTAFTG